MTSVGLRVHPSLKNRDPLRTLLCLCICTGALPYTHDFMADAKHTTCSLLWYKKEHSVAS